MSSCKTLFILTGIVFLLYACKDSCEEINCMNGGTCIDGACDCPPGYTGETCSTEDRIGYLGVFNVTDQCPNIATYTVNVEADTADIHRVYIANFFNSFSNLVEATVDGTLITISPQSPDGDGRVVSGNGTFIPPDRIVWNYSVLDISGPSYNCENSIWEK